MKARVLVPANFGAPLGMYSHGVVAPAGELVVVAGQVGTRADGSLAGEDVTAQTAQALENVRAVLQAAGGSMADVIRFQTFLTSADDIPGFMRARQEMFPRYFPDGAYPPNTLLVVNRLVLPGLRVEIEAMAVRPRRAPTAARPSATKARAGRRARRAAIGNGPWRGDSGFGRCGGPAGSEVSMGVRSIRTGDPDPRRWYSGSSPRARG